MLGEGPGEGKGRVGVKSMERPVEKCNFTAIAVLHALIFRK
jgi:hypothetical protein